MKKLILLLAILGSGFFAADVRGASFFGRVIEVNSGDVITVFNLNRPVRVRLMGVDAPELSQQFGEVAKKHLADLVYDKSVMVEYSGIGPDSSLNGRVLLDATDVGAQMIRDGAAWFDPNNQNRLSATDRDVYQHSEQAARSERRGLWQAENPVAPWAFVKAEALRQNPVASLNEIFPSAKPKRNGPAPELTNLTIMTAGMSAAGPRPALSNTARTDSSWASTSNRKNWRQLRPAGEDFSVLVPEEGKQATASTPFGDQMVDVNSYLARDGWVIYSVAWLAGPSYGETDQMALKGSLQSYLAGLEQGYQNGSGMSDFKCEPRAQKSISQNGYTGVEFDLTSCTLPTIVRMYTKVVDNQRRLYMGAVLYSEEDENVNRFLKSFTVGSTTRAR